MIKSIVVYKKINILDRLVGGGGLGGCKNTTLKKVFKGEKASI